MKDSYNCDALSIAGATAAIEDLAWFTETRGLILASRARLIDALVGWDLPASTPKQTLFGASTLNRPANSCTSI